MEQPPIVSRCIVVCVVGALDSRVASTAGGGDRDRGRDELSAISAVLGRFLEALLERRAFLTQFFQFAARDGDLLDGLRIFAIPGRVRTLEARLLPRALDTSNVAAITCCLSDEMTLPPHSTQPERRNTSFRYTCAEKREGLSRKWMLYRISDLLTPTLSC